MGPRILIAGVGNIFLGDDGFGVEAVRQLAQREWPAGVHIVDFGIRALDLQFALMEDYETVILVDAVHRGCEPGTLFVLEPEVATTDNQLSDGFGGSHGLRPAEVLRMAKSVAGKLPTVRIVGCQPGDLGTDDTPATGLSRPVQAAIGEAVSLIEKLVDEFGKTRKSPCTS